MRVVYSRRALAQLHEIITQIAAENRSAAAAFGARVETFTNLAARHPMIGRQTDLERVRVFPLKPYPYLLFYRIWEHGEGVAVLRIRHDAKGEDWKRGR